MPSDWVIFGFPGAGGEDVGWHGSRAGFDDEVETFGEESTKHELNVFLSGFGRGLWRGCRNGHARARWGLPARWLHRLRRRC